MTEVEKLRALLAEAKNALRTNDDDLAATICVRIDAALAEPVAISPMADVAARMGAHAIGHREGWEAGFAAGKKDAEHERDEARAEVAKMKEAGSWMDKVVLNAACAVAFRRGAEAMREAAAKACDFGGAVECASAIRVLALPEDEP